MRSSVTPSTSLVVALLLPLFSCFAPDRILRTMLERCCNVVEGTAGIMSSVGPLLTHSCAWQCNWDARGLNWCTKSPPHTAESNRWHERVSLYWHRRQFQLITSLGRWIFSSSYLISLKQGSSGYLSKYTSIRTLLNYVLGYVPILKSNIWKIVFHPELSFLGNLFGSSVETCFHPWSIGSLEVLACLAV